MLHWFRSTSFFLLALFSLHVNASNAGEVLNGIDVLELENFKPLKNLRVGLITNPSGVNRSHRSTIDILNEARSLKLVKLFSPEHGIRGNLDQPNISDSLDDKTKLPIISLFGPNKAPLPKHLDDIDALVFDIQDIGTRFFTYISTMKLSMQAASKAGKKFIVLDRINPIGGVIVEGPVNVDREVFVGIHSVPVRHGMTVGELAQLFKHDLKLDLELEIIKLRGWKRSMQFRDTGIKWINPSPIMNGPLTATLYPGVGLHEFSVSVGRGTDLPFEMLGAPYINGRKLEKKLNTYGLKGVSFSAYDFTPTKSVFENEACEGISFKVTDEDSFRPTAFGLALAHAIYSLYPRKYDLEKFNILTLHKSTIDAIRTGTSYSKILAMWEKETQAFKKKRKEFLLYD